MACYERWPRTASHGWAQFSAQLLEDEDMLIDEEEPSDSYEQPASISIVLKSAYNNPPTKQDWQKIRPVFTKLYFTEAKPLKDVMSELEGKHGFHSSMKMYKTYITRWHLRRSLNREEVIQIIGTEASRKARGKDTVFWLRGHLVDMDNIYRYQRRKGLKTIDAVRLFNLKQAKLCPDLQACSPPDTSAAAILVESDYGLKHCLFEYRAMLDGMLQCQMLIMESTGLIMNWKHELSGVVDNDFLIPLGLNFLNEEFGQAYFLSLRRFSILLENFTEEYNPGIINHLFVMIAQLRLKDAAAANIIFSHLRSLMKSRKFSTHPGTKFWMASIELDQDEIALLTVKLWEVFLSKVVEVQKSNHPAVGSLALLDSQVRLYRTCSNLGFFADKHQMLLCLKDSLESSICVEPPILVALTFVLGEWPELREEPKFAEYLTWLADPAKLSTTERGLSYAGYHLTFYTAFQLVQAYFWIRKYELERKLLQCLLECHKVYRLNNGQLWLVLEYLDWLSTHSDIADGNMCWREMMTDIEDEWLAEVEAAVPDDNLLEVCQYLESS